MILKFQLDNITSKDADDITMLVTQFIQQECDYMVSDYWVEEDDGR